MEAAIQVLFGIVLALLFRTLWPAYQKLQAGKKVDPRYVGTAIVSVLFTIPALIPLANSILVNTSEEYLKLLGPVAIGFFATVGTNDFLNRLVKPRKKPTQPHTAHAIVNTSTTSPDDTATFAITVNDSTVSTDTWHADSTDAAPITDFPTPPMPAKKDEGT